MAAPRLAAAASTLGRVGTLELKAPSSVSSDSLRILTTKQSCIPRPAPDHRSGSESRSFSKRGTIDKAVLNSILGAAIGLAPSLLGIPAAVLQQHLPSKMAAPGLAAAASTLGRVGTLELKAPSSVSSDSLRILTTKQSCIPRPAPDHRSGSESKSFSKRGTIDKAVLNSILGAAIGLGGVAVGIPIAVGAVGFTGAGIVAGSLGAKMMSAAAIANGGGVAAGGLVATLQSIGAAGVPTAVSAATTATGAVLGALKGIWR